jgi:uncharacterized protein
MADRDRDPSGRPRNSRGRDALGRPLPRDAAEAEPGARWEPRSPGGPGEAAGLGGTLLLAGHPFHAHEVFEDAWKGATGAERDLWRGLAQVAVGLTHARRGNARGAVALLRRGADLLRDYAARRGPARAYGIDASHVASSAGDLAARIEREGLEALPEEAFLMSLGPGPGGRGD